MGALTKPEPLPPDQLDAFHEVESRMKLEADKLDVTWNHALEGKFIREGVKVYSSKLDRLPLILNQYDELRASNDPFWKPQPPLPSRLFSPKILSMVEAKLASKAPPAHAEQPRCPVCETKIATGALDCHRCGFLLHETKNLAAIKAARAAWSAKEKS